MGLTINTRRRNPLATLGKLARGATASQEQCDFCSEPLGLVHRHLLEVANRKIVCACDACALRFDHAVGRFTLIPRDTRSLPHFSLTDEQWAGLALPIDLAFIFQSTAQSRAVALYPSPAGTTESLLPLASWEELKRCNPTLEEMAADVEALLVNRAGDSREYYVAPIDVCYELSGIIRIHWRGLSGGERVWQEVKNFFARLSAAAIPVLPQGKEASRA